jgi:hypothetical protein
MALIVYNQHTQAIYSFSFAAHLPVIDINTSQNILGGGQLKIKRGEKLILNGQAWPERLQSYSQTLD